MTRRRKKQTVFPLPVPLPTDFADVIGYRKRRSMFALFWFHPLKWVMWFDGIRFSRANDEPFVTLCLEKKVVELTERHAMRLWGCTTMPTHWLLVEGDNAWLATGEVAR